MNSESLEESTKKPNRFEAKRRAAINLRNKRAKEKKDFLECVNSNNIQMEDGVARVTVTSDFLPIKGLTFR